MIIGFTGTQKGMTYFQKQQVELLLLGIEGEFHHGDCIGADAEAHDIAEKYLKCIIHPPINNDKRAFKKANIILEPKEYLDRNKDIVKACERLIATPEEYQEQLRSGTWSTVRYARKMKKLIAIIFPNGVRKFENAH